MRQFPYVTPVSQTSVHSVVPEDLWKEADQRERRGEVKETKVVNLPPNSIMIIYPISTADRSGPSPSNTVAGNWLVNAKTRSQPNIDRGHGRIDRYGNFPYIQYTSKSHSLHGPITFREGGLFWRVRRGEVSHGCNRMQGEHIVELSVLMGCGKDPRVAQCPDPQASELDNEYVTVMEDFDIIPDPSKVHSEGILTAWDTVREHWLAVEVDFPREKINGRTAFELYGGRLGGQNGWFLMEGKNGPHRSPRGGDPKNKPFVYYRVFKSWDNRHQHLVVGKNC